MKITACPMCQSDQIELFHSLDNVPTNSFRLTKSYEEAKELARGSMKLSICNNCSFVFNADFDQSLPIYDELYEASQGFSKTFQEWTTDVVGRFVDRYDLVGKHFCELGCGQGEFLAETITQTKGTGVGYDPAWVKGFVDDSVLSSIQYKKEFFDDTKIGEKFDAFIHRHTLEHISDIVGHMTMVRSAMQENPGSVMFLEVPDGERIWSEIAFWDVFYEHCNYFTKETLVMLLERVGFEVLDVRYEYSDQYLVAEVKAGEPQDINGVDIDLAMKNAQYFKEQFTDKRDEINNMMSSSIRPVIWGGGSKGVGFLTTMGFDENHVKYAVDIDPHKQGTFMAGSGQPVVNPDTLVDYQPDLVVVMNPVYKEEIRAQLESIGVKCAVEAL